MGDEHYECACEQYVYWRRLGLSHGEMLAAIGIAGPNAPTAIYVICCLADAASDLRRRLADAA